MHNLTDEELEQKLVSACRRSMTGELSNARDYHRHSGERTKGHEEALPLAVEAATRGILLQIQVRNEDVRIPFMRENQQLSDLIICMRENCATRGFLSDRRCLAALEELMAFRKVFRRQALTGEDVRRELNEYQAATFDEKVPRASVFEAGLRRGFAMRAEERQPTTTKPAAN